MNLSISRPLLALLLCALVISTVIALRPADDAGEQVADDLLPTRTEKGVARHVSDAAPTWRRQTYKPGARVLGEESVVVAPAAALAPMIAAVPTAPENGFVYLGRMVRDGKVYAFVGKGEDVEVVSAGDDISPDWRLDAIENKSLRVRYLPLNEVRNVAMSHEK